MLHVAATVAATAPLTALTAGGAAKASPETPASAPRRIRKAVLVPRFGGDATADWYSTAVPQLAGLGIRTKVVSLLPEPTAPGIDETVAAIAKAVAGNPHEIAQTILIGHSVGSRALLAYLSRHGAHRTFAGLVSVAGWFTVDDLRSYPAIASWVTMDLNFASIAAAADAVSNEDGFGDLRRVVPDCLGNGRHRFIDAGRGRLGQQRNHLCPDAETGQLTQRRWIPVGGGVTAESGHQNRPPDAARSGGGDLWRGLCGTPGDCGEGRGRCDRGCHVQQAPAGGRLGGAVGRPDWVIREH